MEEENTRTKQYIISSYIKQLEKRVKKNPKKYKKFLDQMKYIQKYDLGIHTAQVVIRNLKKIS